MQFKQLQEEPLGKNKMRSGCLEEIARVYKHDHSPLLPRLVEIGDFQLVKKVKKQMSKYYSSHVFHKSEAHYHRNAKPHDAQSIHAQLAWWLEKEPTLQTVLQDNRPIFASAKSILFFL
ncbi:hypothetical protein [Fluviicola chungangensis]|uniref:Uncharacterized protein n=1 Tax=Fluviicola chungangensis TaxID=2597671 RepID=A0A556N3F6_9FLAO|nr:hypothetical protein [Fluviicola chungangensis]TSJ46747.1 hypothetical protein FO442_06185 [Fluviicola chungangensis]